MKVILITVFSFLLLSSCKDAEEKAYERLNQEVMSLHDELMPKTEDLIKYKNKLDSLGKGVDSVHVNRLKIALDRSDKAMMDWMHGFSVDSLERLSMNDKISYLNAQYSQLKWVQKLTDSTLNVAKTYTSH